MPFDDIQIDTGDLELFTRAMRRNGNDENLSAQVRQVIDKAPNSSHGGYAAETKGIGNELQSYTTQLTRLYAQSALFFDKVQAHFDENDYINM